MPIMQALDIQAGPAALERIRRDGFDHRQVRLIAGASGGPKWLVLLPLDRYLAGQVFRARREPLFFLGSSIGAWRGAAYAMERPLDALNRLAERYTNYDYKHGYDVDQVTEESWSMLDTMLGDAGATEILSNPAFRLGLISCRGRGPLSSDDKWLLGPSLVLAATANLINRHLLAAFFRRSIFYDPRDPPPYRHVSGFGAEFTALEAANLRDALMASGSIPMVTHGVRDISGAPHGTYRDGGIIDYHLDLDFGVDDGFVLYPHFYPWLIPGWFDKQIQHRVPNPAHLRNVVLVSPSREFIATLPHGKVPDRRDFVNFPDPQRIENWRRTIAEAERIADEFAALLETEDITSRVRPLTNHR